MSGSDVPARPTSPAVDARQPVVLTEADYQAIADEWDGLFLPGALKEAIDNRLAEKQRCK